MRLVDTRKKAEKVKLRNRQRKVEERMGLCHQRLEKLDDTLGMLPSGEQLSYVQLRTKKAIRREQEVLEECMVEWLALDEEIDECTEETMG